MILLPVTLQLRVVEARELNPLIRMIRLSADDGRGLSAYAAGAHIRVQVAPPDGTQDWRYYSLINFETQADATDAPTDYVIAVRREAEGRGGARFMNERRKKGDLVTIEAPKNDFPLHVGPGGTVLLAGGIGVSPLTSMATRRRAEGLPVRLHYAGRSRELMAILPELQALLGDALHHARGRSGRPRVRG